MDSIAITYWKRPKHAFTINYGQKAALAEIQSAAQVCAELGIIHNIINVDCSSLGSGEMAGVESLNLSPAVEWWPYRNQLLVTLACMKGISLGIEELYVGSVITDNVHIDGSEAFYQNLSKVIEMQEGNIKISYPAISMTTSELIINSKVPRSILLWAHSCHTANNPCSNCNGCKKYLFTLQNLGFD